MRMRYVVGNVTRNLGASNWEYFTLRAAPLTYCSRPGLRLFSLRRGMAYRAKRSMRLRRLDTGIQVLPWITVVNEPVGRR